MEELGRDKGANVSCGACEHHVFYCHHVALLFFFLLRCFFSFLCRLQPFLRLFIPSSMPSSDFDEDDFDWGGLRSQSPPTVPSQLGLEDDNFGNYDANPSVRRPLLRRTRAMDFSLQRSIAGYPSSQMSGSTLRAHSDPSFALPAKAASSIGVPSRLSIEAIVSLTPSELDHNPFYRELLDDNAYLSRVLATYLGKELRVTHPHAARNDDVFRGMCY